MVTLTLCLIFFISLSIVLLYDLFKKRRNSESFIDTFKSSDGVAHLKLINNNKEYYFLIDTGANSSYITPEVLTELKGKKTTKSTATIATATGNLSAKYSKIPFTFNKESFEFDFWILDIKDALSTIKINNNPVVGVIGTDFLAHFGFTLDFNDFKIYKP